MTEWFTNNCEETKDILGREYHCCRSCHDDVGVGFRDCIEKYTKNKGLLFYACCGFPKLSEEEWIIFEKTLRMGDEK